MGHHFDVASCPPIVWQKTTGLRVVCYSSHILPRLYNNVILCHYSFFPNNDGTYYRYAHAYKLL